MNDRKITIGFETPTDEAHNTHIIHTTVSELRREVAARFEALIDKAENSGPLKGLWDAIDFGECDNLWVSDHDDEIRLECSCRPGIHRDRPSLVLSEWLTTDTVAVQ